MTLTAATEPTTAALIIEVLTSGPFLGLACLALAAFACAIALIHGGHTVEFTDGSGDIEPLEMTAARQADIASLAVPDIWAPTIPVEQDPTRSRSGFRVYSNPEREARVRSLQGRSQARRRIDPFLSQGA